MTNIFIRILAAALALGLAACSEQDKAPAAGPVGAAVPKSTPDTQIEKGIAWFQGGVDEAFAAARAQDKPVFLYFGAEWCPYCKELQATVFRRDRFIELSRQFVAIDLGQDSTDSIRHGDRFNVYGLPTVIVFSPSGEEITRIAGGMDMENYAAVLELTLNSIRPVAELVARVQDGAQLEDDDWRLLGAYSWGQDKGQALGEQDVQQVLRELIGGCPAHLYTSCSRLLVAALAEWGGEEERDRALGDAYLPRLESLLADDVLSRENLVGLAEISGEVVSELAAGDAQAALRATFQQRFAEALAEPDLNVLTRTYALAGWVAATGATLAEDATLPPEQAAWVKAEADQLVAALGPYQQHAGINTLWQVYYDAGLTGDARATLLRGIEVSRAPYYFMSNMGYIEREAGNTEAALDWYRRAWDASTGPTTRVRWGAGYLRRLIDMTPEDTDGIAAASEALLKEAGGQQRWIENYQRGFGRLSETLLAWSDAAEGEELARREAVLSRLRATMDKLCEGSGSAGEPADICTGFLAATVPDATPPA